MTSCAESWLILAGDTARVAGDAHVTSLRIGLLNCYVSGALEDAGLVHSIELHARLAREALIACIDASGAVVRAFLTNIGSFGYVRYPAIRTAILAIVVMEELCYWFTSWWHFTAQAFVRLISARFTRIQAS